MGRYYTGTVKEQFHFKLRGKLKLVRTLNEKWLSYSTFTTSTERSRPGTSGIWRGTKRTVKGRILSLWYDTLRVRVSLRCPSTRLGLSPVSPIGSVGSTPRSVHLLPRRSTKVRGSWVSVRKPRRVDFGVCNTLSLLSRGDTRKY